MAGKWTTVAFSESQDENATYTGVAAVSDQTVKTSGDTLYIPDEFPYLAMVAAMMGGTVPGNPYLDSPSLRATALLDISPVHNATLPTEPFPLMDKRQNPFKLKADEGLLAWSNANPAAAEYHTILGILSDGIIDPVKGDIFTVRFTTSFNTVAGAWTYGAITMSQNLPSGRYSVVGAQVIGANLNAFRFVPIGYTNRPGFIASQDIADSYAGIARNGQLGKWFEFDHNNPPGIELLSIAVVAASVGYLDLIKVG